MAVRSWLILDEGRASALAALCETIVPGSGRVQPALYVDAQLARMDETGREMALGAIDALADVADGGAEALGERAATGCIRISGTLATPSWIVHPTIGSMNSWNWAARTIRTGRGPSSSFCS